jgi:hypothetical protein
MVLMVRPVVDPPSVVGGEDEGVEEVPDGVVKRGAVG